MLLTLIRRSRHSLQAVDRLPLNAILNRNFAGLGRSPRLLTHGCIDLCGDLDVQWLEGEVGAVFRRAIPSLCSRHSSKPGMSLVI
jgi:hypothetical protein